jgi:hypothetical protein
MSDFRRFPFLLVFSSVSVGSEEHNSDDGDDVKSSSGTEGSTPSSLAFVTENYGNNVSSTQLYSKTPINISCTKVQFQEPAFCVIVPKVLSLTVRSLEQKVAL